MGRVKELRMEAIELLWHIFVDENAEDFDPEVIVFPESLIHAMAYVIVMEKLCRGIDGRYKEEV